MLKYQNTKTFLQRVTLQIGLKKPLRSRKWKVQYHGHTLSPISMVKRLLEHSMKKSCRWQAKKNSGLESNQEKR